MRFVLKYSESNVEELISTIKRNRIGIVLSEGVDPNIDFPLIKDADGYVDETATELPGRDLKSELEAGKALFFPFVGPLCGEVPFPAANGLFYNSKAVPVGNGKDFEEDALADDEDSDEELPCDDSSVYGFTVVVDTAKDIVSFQTSKLFLGMCMPPSPPQVEPQDGNVIESALASFINSMAKS